MKAINIQDLSGYTRREDFKILQALLEELGLEISESSHIVLARSERLGNLLPSLIKVVRHSLFEPDNSPSWILEKAIEEIFYSSPEALNYVILGGCKNDVLGTAQAYQLCNAAIWNLIAFSPHSPSSPRSIRNQGYYSLVNCLRFLFALSRNCHFVSGITSNPIVIAKLDQWGFFYSVPLYTRVHPECDIRAEKFEKLQEQAIELWIRIAGKVETERLILERENVPHGQFKIARTLCRNNIINHFIAGNLSEGDRMIFIKELDESTPVLLFNILNDFLSKRKN